MLKTGDSARKDRSLIRKSWFDDLRAQTDLISRECKAEAKTNHSRRCLKKDQNGSETTADTSFDKHKEKDEAIKGVSLKRRSIKEELAELELMYGFTRPPRPDVNDVTVKWRYGTPCFDRADLEFFRGRSTCHKEGSLEETVENLVKRWEMELSHKVDYTQWQTVDQQRFSLSANGGRRFSGPEIHEQGNYQALLSQCRKTLYDCDEENFDTSHKIFKGAFTQGFPWEVLRVFSAPPRVVFTWRHWGRFTGRYKDRRGRGETINMYGITVAMVNERLKIESIEVYYDPEFFLERLLGENLNVEQIAGEELIGKGCPFAARQKI